MPRLSAMLLALLLCVVAARAGAHAILIGSEPASGSAVPAGAVPMAFRFNSRIDRDRSRLTLTRPDRSQLVLPIEPGGPPDVLRAQADLSPGAYSVRWQVLAVDGHITRGDVAFTVVRQ